MNRPRLHSGMSPDDFDALYWMKDDLVRFARKLGLSTGGAKPELEARILRHLRGERPEEDEHTKCAGARKGRTKCRKSASASASGPGNAVTSASVSGRDSDAPLTRATPVVRYKSDAKTRAFFESEIGPHFHFTWHLNQYRLAREGRLTYGDLVDEWTAEHERRNKPGYRATIAKHGEWNRFVRDFFADTANRGKSIREAAALWRKVKPTRDRTYASWKRRTE